MKKKANQGRQEENQIGSAGTKDDEPHLGQGFKEERKVC
jgi:hypothetical protein